MHSFLSGRLLLAFLLTLNISGQSISFLAPAEVYSSGASLASDMCGSCITTADFNGDGNMDIAYAGFVLLPFAGVVLGNGDGTFRAGPQFEGTPSSGSVFSSDFNGDGKPDLLIAGQYQTWVYLGDGTGNFSAPIDVVGFPAVTTVADVNGDGKADLICGSSVLIGKGDGTFLASPSTLDGTAILAADFNTDGKVDLLLTNSTGGIAVVLGRGNGTFGTDLEMAGAAGLQLALTGDFNGDGHIDIAGLSADGATIIVRPGRGDGTFGTVLNTVGASGMAMAAGDLNHDGKLDLMVGDGVFAGKGDGTFRIPVYVGAFSKPCGFTPSWGTDIPCDYRRPTTAIADFNGDGLPDIAAGVVAFGDPLGHRIALVTVLLNNSPGDGFTSPGISSATWTSPVGPASLVSAFGVDLAPKTEAATTNPAPTTLGGVRVHVRDRSHQEETLAPLLFVSPGQINYVLPASEAFALVTIERVGTPYVPKGMAVPVSPVAPGLFTRENGVAAATAVRVAADGSQTAVASTQPIDVLGDPVYVSLYGTGFAGATGGASCHAGSVDIAPSYAGPQTQIAGLDQINLLLPKSLQGAGATSIACAFGTATSNAVSLQIQ